MGQFWVGFKKFRDSFGLVVSGTVSDQYLNRDNIVTVFGFWDTFGLRDRFVI